MKRLIKLAKALSSMGLKSSAASIIKIAGEEEVNYLESLNFKAWTKDKSPPEGSDKKEFWMGIQKEFKERQGGGPLFDKRNLELIKDFDSSKLPKKESKRFVKWLGRWILEWNELSTVNQNTILDWWSVTGGVEEGRPFNEEMIELLNPEYALQRAKEYHDDSDFYFDPTESYITPPDQNVIYDFGDGYKIVYVPATSDGIQPYPFTEQDLIQLKIDPYEAKDTSHDRVVEGNKMGICLGKKMRLYQDNSEGSIYSLRNAKNEPCVTIRASEESNEQQYLENGKDVSVIHNTLLIHESLGKGNSTPSKQYADYVLRFFREAESNYNDVDIEDQFTLALTRMNSKHPEERKSGINYALKNPGVASDIFSIDWKTIQQEEPEKFKRMIVNNIFSYVEDSLDSEKLGGDQEKIKLIKESWEDAGPFYPLKKIKLSSGEKFLLEIIPEAIKKIKIEKVLEISSLKRFGLQENSSYNMTDEVRNILWNGLVKRNLSSINSYDAISVVDMFYPNIIDDGGSSLDVENLALGIFYDILSRDVEEKRLDIIRKIESIFPKILEGRQIRGDQSIHNLSRSIREKIVNQQMKQLEGTSPFDLLKVLNDLGYRTEEQSAIDNSKTELSYNQVKDLFLKSNLNTSGTVEQLYKLMNETSPHHYLPKEFWHKNLYEAASKLNPSNIDAIAEWIILVNEYSYGSTELSEIFYEKLKEDRQLFLAACKSGELNNLYHEERIEDLSSYHFNRSI